jgi:hypothetical protein
MSTIPLPVAVVARARDLFTLFAKKAAFDISEFADAGSVFKRITELLEGAKPDTTIEVGEIDVKYLMGAINVCCQRTPVEVQNYKPIAELLESLSSAIKVVDTEESKSD